MRKASSLNELLDWMSARTGNFELTGRGDVVVGHDVVESLWSVLLNPASQRSPLRNTHQGRPSLSFTGVTAFSFPFALAPAMRADIALKGLACVGAKDVEGSSTSIGSLMVLGVLLDGR